MSHQPVLCDEAMEALRIKPEGCYVDCTYGRGGHSQAILQRLGKNGRLWVLDRDPEAIQHAMDTISSDARVMVVRSVFSTMPESAVGLDGVLFDLGVSLNQLRNNARGFSFNSDAIVDMRMDPDRGESAAAWLARVGMQELENVLRECGGERYAGRIAKAIIANRPAGGWRAGSLASCIAAAVPRSRQRLHPATRSFQAIRIKVNDELSELKAALAATSVRLARCGRLVVISFHSLEDRIVKQFFKMTNELQVIGSLIRPTDAEKDANMRARSARMRVAEKFI